ncbi:UbiA family prenyltransferase [Sphaerisporangium perillae]|uniref:UbiA family prenyltransferase n=1 Tax=Sphaerisporangium perillae TaxID=2935860 RepID=UPI00200D09DD|nr:UbiA family prenyltransferase [Sphaerisporangium perillae]
MLALIRACHPGPTVVVTAVGSALAAGVGRGAGGTLLVGAAVLSGQLSIGWSNDWIDRTRDRVIGRADKPLAGDAVAPRTVARAAFAALVACVPLSLASGVLAGLVHLVAVACGWLYNLRLKASPASPLPFAAAFGLLPAFVTLGLPGNPWPAWWAILAGALLGMGAHFANVLPDLPDDLALGVRGLPQRLGPTGARMGAAVLLVAASVVIALAPEDRGGPVTVAGLAAVVLVLGGGLLAGRGDLRRAAFAVTVAVAVIDVAMFVAQGGRLV